jgi:hypothetical protein
MITDMVLTDVLLSLQIVNFTLMIHEWQSMIYLIETQKGRSIEQILYDHETEILQKSFLGNI